MQRFPTAQHQPGGGLYVAMPSATFAGSRLWCMVVVYLFTSAPVCILLVGMLLQVVKEKPGLWSFILSPEAEGQEEHFMDAPEEGEDAKQDCEEHKTDDGVGSGYRGLHRNPLYCRAETSCLWELERVRCCMKCLLNSC